MVIIDGVVMVDVREASRLAGRTPETVRRWVWSGRVDAVKQGNRLLLVRDQIPTRDPATDGTGAGMTLRAWAADMAAAPARGRRGGTASDLVLADRSGRQ